MFTLGGSAFTVGGATQNCYEPHGPKIRKKSPGFDKIIVLIMKDESLMIKKVLKYT